MSRHTHDPVNYVLTGSEPHAAEDFKAFLDNLTDVPASTPLENIDINEAGITNQKIVIYVADIENNKESIPVFCNLTMSVKLTRHRGIHMSRCEEALYEVAEKKYSTLDDFALMLSEKLKEKQKSKESKVSCEGIYIHKRFTKKTKKVSHDRFYLLNETTNNEEGCDVMSGVSAYNMTGCPCTRTYTKYSVLPQLKSLGLSLQQIQKVLDMTTSGTHTQRGTTALWVEKFSKDVNHKELYRILEQSCHLVYELLKRPDEHQLVLDALNKPQFTEDVAREVARNTISRYGKIAPPQTKLKIESILFDSIHIHDVRTLIETNFHNVIKA